MPKAEFQREVEKELTGKDSEPSELIYFKVYKSQIPVIEQAIETAALMLGSDKSRGHCLEMICADFLAGACLDGNHPEILLRSISRYYKFLPSPQQEIDRNRISGWLPSRQAPARKSAQIISRQYPRDLSVPSIREAVSIACSMTGTWLL